MPKSKNGSLAHTREDELKLDAPGSAGACVGLTNDFEEHMGSVYHSEYATPKGIDKTGVSNRMEEELTHKETTVKHD